MFPINRQAYVLYTIVVCSVLSMHFACIHMWGCSYIVWHVKFLLVSAAPTDCRIRTKKNKTMHTVLFVTGTASSISYLKFQNIIQLYEMSGTVNEGSIVVYCISLLIGIRLQYLITTDAVLMFSSVKFGLNFVSFRQGR